jgi:hypothetical protein
VIAQPITLTLPGGVVPAAYAQVRADAILGAALFGEMIAALERAGEPAARIGAFLAARDTALAGWKAPPEPSSTATGPGPGAPHPVRLAFDQVSTDVLRAWFIQSSEAVAAAGPKDHAVATLVDLETRARAAFAWDAGAAESVAVRVMLVRRSLEQR